MTNTTTTTSASASVKFTQRDCYNALRAFLTDGVALPEGMDILAFIDGRIAQLDKKSATKGEAKPTARQIENDGIKAGIIANMEPNTLYQVGEMLKSFDCFSEDMTSQRVSALVKQLVDAGLVERLEDKRKAYFRLVNAE